MPAPVPAPPAANGDPGSGERTVGVTINTPMVLVSVVLSRVLGPNTGRAKLDIFVGQPEKLTNDLSVNLLDMPMPWGRVLDMKAHLRGPRPRPTSITVGAVGFVADVAGVEGICGR